MDGCSQLEAFWRVIIPVMWPGVITTGLFSFLLAYNDYLVTRAPARCAIAHHGPHDQPVPGERDQRDRAAARHRSRRLHHRPAVPPGAGVPATSRRGSHARRRQRLMADINPSSSRSALTGCISVAAMGGALRSGATTAEALTFRGARADRSGQVSRACLRAC